MVRSVKLTCKAIKFSEELSDSQTLKSSLFLQVYHCLERLCDSICGLHFKLIYCGWIVLQWLFLVCFRQLWIFGKKEEMVPARAHKHTYVYIQIPPPLTHTHTTHTHKQAHEISNVILKKMGYASFIYDLIILGKIYWKIPILMYVIFLSVDTVQYFQLLARHFIK